MEFGKITNVPQGVEWTIADFLSLQVGFYDSPTFPFDAESWELRISVCRTDVHNGRVIALLLRRTTRCRPLRLECSISVKLRDGRKHGEMKETRDFDDEQNGFCSGFIRLDPHGMSEWLQDGTLTVLCTLKQQQRNAAVSSAPIRIFPEFEERQTVSKRRRCGSVEDFSSGANDDSASAQCSYCKESFNAGSISSHEKKCLDKPVKCPECSDVVLLQSWYDHECKNEGAGDENSATGSKVPLHENELVQDLKQLFLSQEDSDVILRVKGREFKAHRIILKARSPVFKSIFRSDMKENATGVVDIQDLDPSAFSDFLCFLYCGESEILSEENVLGLFMAADKYDVPKLRAKCVEFMEKNLSTDTFCDVIRLALLHSETELIQFSTDFYIKNASKITKTVEWQRFVIENPVQGNELFIKFLSSNENQSK